MRPLAALLVVLAVLLAGCGDKGGDDGTPTLPTVTPTPALPDPPTVGSVVSRVNDTWTYTGENGETVVSSVTGVNQTIVRLKTVSQRVNATPHTTITIFDAKTLAIMSVQDDTIGGGVVLRFEPPLPVIIPAEDHDYNGSLVATTPFGDVRQTATGTVRFLGGAHVDVPAGSFYAYGYNATIQSDGLFPFGQTIETWFAPEVEQAVKSTRDGRLQEMTSYTIS